jgi:hypothetical protein
LTVALVVDDDDGTAAAGAPGGPGARAVAPSTGGAPAPVDPGPDDAEEHIDPSELRDADDVATNGVDLLLREFGGGEVVEEEP